MLNNISAFKAGISTGSHYRSKNGVNKSFADTTAQLEFAQQALDRFRSEAPFAITDRLFGVDIFQAITGKMVVNEFESFDAEYQTKTTGTDEATYSFLEMYWYQKLKKFIL